MNFVVNHFAVIPGEAGTFKSRTTRLPKTARVIFLLVVLAAVLTLGSSCGGGASAASAPSQGTQSFSLSSTPAKVTLQLGASGSTSIAIAAAGGFSGSVNLAATGLPAGVTAAFSPAATTSTSTLTLTVSGSAAAGSSTISVNGTSGTLNASASISLTIIVPPPAGSLPASFFALNNVDPTDDPSVDGLTYGAVGHPIRLAWPYIETSRGVYDFSFYDEYAAIAPRQGSTGNIAVMDLTLGITPGWAIANQTGAECRSLNGGVIGCQAPPDDIQDWKDFVTALVKHYNGSSPTQPYIKYYEVWNEWNTQDAANGFWNGTIPQLVNLEQSACSIVHTHAAGFSFVVSPSTVGAATTSADAAPQQLQQFLQAGGGSCIDAVSFHGNLGLVSLNPYPLPGEGCTGSGCNGTIVQIANSYREVLNLNGPLNVPLLDTEGGFESANITDIDQRAAWLAQFYALQAGVFNSDQLQWVSWFTWGAPGVAGNIETAGKTPDAAGVAYNQVYNWLFGRFPSPCVQAGMLWTCPVTGAAGYQAEIVWDDSQTCLNGACSSAAQLAPTWAVKYRDLAGNSTQVSGTTIPVGLKPVILENQ
jgi:hypothetical protein